MSAYAHCHGCSCTPRALARIQATHQLSLEDMTKSAWHGYLAKALKPQIPDWHRNVSFRSQEPGLRHTSKPLDPIFISSQQLVFIEFPSSAREVAPPYRTAHICPRLPAFASSPFRVTCYTAAVLMIWGTSLCPAYPTSTYLGDTVIMNHIILPLSISKDLRRPFIRSVLYRRPQRAPHWQSGTG